MTRAEGQSTLEYLLVVVGILLAILFAVGAKGPLQGAVGGLLDDTSAAIGRAVNDVSSRFP